MKKYALSNVSPVAITIVKQGANRQRLFLKKDGGTDTAALLELPADQSTILPAADGDGDWSTMYCVVAEPGAEEDPGMVGDQESVDVWADEHEIAKAAHALLKNKGYVNAMHDALEEEGCHLVENAIAHADFTVTGPDGFDHTIKKGSWFVGIEPSEDFKAKVDAGEITGVSLEGTGTRTLLEKAKTNAPSAQGKKGVDRDSGTRRCPSCGSKVKTGIATCPNCKNALKKARGEQIEKAVQTFAAVIGERELTDALWRAWSALEGVIYEALRDDETDDPHGVIRTSIDEFRDYLIGKLDDVDGDAEALRKELGSLTVNADPEEDMGLTQDLADLKKMVEEQGEKVEEVAKSGAENSTAIGKLAEIAETLAKGQPSGDGKGDGAGDGDAPEDVEGIVKAIGKLADKQDESDAELKNIAKAVRNLGQGSSTQGSGDDGEPVRKSKDPLAGLLD